jgi:hypothetical protein
MQRRIQVEGRQIQLTHYRISGRGVALRMDARKVIARIPQSIISNDDGSGTPETTLTLTSPVYSGPSPTWPAAKNSNIPLGSG